MCQCICISSNTPSACGEPERMSSCLHRFIYVYIYIYIYICIYIYIYKYIYCCSCLRSKPSASSASMSVSLTNGCYRGGGVSLSIYTYISLSI